MKQAPDYNDRNEISRLLVSHTDRFLCTYSYKDNNQ